MRDPHVRFCERLGGVISRAYSTGVAPSTPIKGIAFEIHSVAIGLVTNKDCQSGAVQISYGGTQ
jgi:hypothetical protein